MATTVLKLPPAFCASERHSGASSSKYSNSTRIFFPSNKIPVIRCRIYNTGYKRTSAKLPSRSVSKFMSFAADGVTTESQKESEEEENTDGAIGLDSSSDNEDTVPEANSSVVTASLNLYKEALENNNASKITEVESALKAIEDEKINLEKKVVRLSEELSYERDRVLRISADFDNFRKRTEKERLSLVSNAQGEVVESLLPILDNFERAKAQIKVETGEEERVNNSYQSIYKQFVEILGSLRVVPVETVGKPFDPMLHEAIMREESTRYKDGVVIEEFRKGFRLGERLLRPSMVKVSSGPGPGPTKLGSDGKEQPQEETTAA